MSIGNSACSGDLAVRDKEVFWLAGGHLGFIPLDQEGAIRIPAVVVSESIAEQDARPGLLGTGSDISRGMILHVDISTHALYDRGVDHPLDDGVGACDVPSKEGHDLVRGFECGLVCAQGCSVVCKVVDVNISFVVYPEAAG